MKHHLLALAFGIGVMILVYLVMNIPPQNITIVHKDGSKTHLECEDSTKGIATCPHEKLYLRLEK